MMAPMIGAADKPSPAWRERVPNGVRRVRVGAPDAPLATLAGALTLTRLAHARHPLPPCGRGFMPAFVPQDDRGAP